jgi:hypothetical protein
VVPDLQDLSAHVGSRVYDVAFGRVSCVACEEYGCTPVGQAHDHRLFVEISIVCVCGRVEDLRLHSITQVENLTSTGDAILRVARPHGRSEVPVLA